MTDLTTAADRPARQRGLRWMERVALLALGLALGLLLAALLAGDDTTGSVATPAPPLSVEDAPADLGDDPAPGPGVALSGLDGVRTFDVRYQDRFNVCAIVGDGTVRCAGDDGWGELAPPADLRLRDVRIGHDTSCGITVEAALTCWGVNAGEVTVAGGFDRLISAPESMFCALRRDGGTSCFEFDGRDWTRTGWTLTHEPFVTADGFFGLVCGVHADASAPCVSAYRGASEDVERFQPPANMTLTLVRVGHETVCGLDLGGRPVCWGRSGPITREAPVEPFVDLVLDFSRACGLLQNGTVACWGDHAAEDSPDDLRITSLRMPIGTGLPCGTTANGRIACWGWPPGDLIDDIITDALDEL